MKIEGDGGLHLAARRARRLEAKLKAVGALADFPVIHRPLNSAAEKESHCDTPQNKSSQHRPIVGGGGRVIGWTDEPCVEPDGR